MASDALIPCASSPSRNIFARATPPASGDTTATFCRSRVLCNVVVGVIRGCQMSPLTLLQRGISHSPEIGDGDRRSP
eukprot:scaffold86606_cov32-Tisochrysis_lutea.AAC.3